MAFSFHLAGKISLPAPPTMIQVGSDERTAVAVCKSKLLRIDLDDRTQVELCTLSEAVTDLSVSTVHHLAAVAMGGAEVAIYNLANGDQLQSMSRAGAPGSLRSAAANRVAVGADGKMLVTTTSGSRIFVSNIETGQWEHIMFVKYDGCGVSVSPDGKFVALFGAPKAAEISGHVSMFLVHRGLQPLWTRWHESDHAVTSCRFSPDSTSLTTCGAGDGARVWDTSSGELQWHCPMQRNKKLHAAWNFGVNEVMATAGDELAVVGKGPGAPTFLKKLKSTDSKFAISQSGKVMVRIDDEKVASIWKLSDSQ